MKNEPVLTAAAITPIAMAILFLLNSFGVGFTSEQQEAIITLVAMVLPLLLAWFARMQVTPTANPKTDEGEQLVPISEAGLEPLPEKAVMQPRGSVGGV